MLETLRGLGQSVKGRIRRLAGAPPTVFHVTHYKAGSQWINRILHALAWERVVEAAPDRSQFFGCPILPGKIYPTVYATHQEFESVALPQKWRRFVIIRDIRDTLISGYFSLKVSHETSSEVTLFARERLHGQSMEEGLLYLARTLMLRVANLQWSWLAAGEPLVKYEDLLTRDVEILEQILLGHCRLPVSRTRLEEVVLANRFEARSGRKRGEEDITSHERKGIAGDWRNYFTPRVLSTVKNYYGSLLIATGYEHNFDW